MASYLKSNEASRNKLREKLLEALKQNPNEGDLQEALTIVEDLILVTETLKCPRSVLVQCVPSSTKRGNVIKMFFPSKLQLIGEFDWDNSTADLGVLVGGMLK